MVHARPDYQRMQDPALEDPALLGEGSSPIGADEPVMLFRARDKHFVAVLLAYRQLLVGDPDMQVDKLWPMLTALGQHIVRAKEWQAEHGCKRPDLPAPPPGDDDGG
jgi:hypothetical protein